MPIQYFLEYERNKLLNQNTFIFFRFLKEKSRDAKAFGLNLEKRLKEIADYSRKKGFSKVIWSNEMLSSFSEDKISVMKNVLESFGKTKIIVFIRRQDKWLQAAYLQWGLKHKRYTGKHIMSFEEFVNLYSDRADYYNLIEKWAKYFSKNNICVQPYEDKQIKPGLISRFCEICKIDPAIGLKYDAKKVYPSLNYTISKMIALYNSNFESVIYPDNVVRLFYNEDLQKSNEIFYASDQNFLDPSHRIELLNMYHDSNMRIAKEFFGRKDGRLFFEPWPSENEKWSQPEEPDMKHLVTVLFDLLVVQNKKLSELSNQIKLIKDKLKKHDK